MSLAAPRIAWSPDGTELLTCVAGTVRRHRDADAQIVAGPEVLDARWHDRSIVTIDHSGVYAHTADGTTRIGELPRRDARDAAGLLPAAMLADDCYLGIIGYSCFVSRFDGRELWNIRGTLHGAETVTSCDLSADGRRVAIGYETAPFANYTYQRQEGRGWMVIDTVKDRVLDRRWTALRRNARPMRHAFDRTGKRIAMATPESGPAIGAIRVGTTGDGGYPQPHVGGSEAVALDDRGIIAAYAYPRGHDGAARQIRVDFLQPGAKGPATIEILDTKWIDSDLDDIVALAFDRASRKIACLNAAAQIDVVPVP